MDASAQDDGDLRLMREPHSYVDVADALDDDDAFDLNVTVGFRHVTTQGNVQRERGAGGVIDPGIDPNRAAQNWTDIARHSHSQNLLDVGLDIGIFRDLMVYGRMPIILSDDRSLSRIEGTNPEQYLQADDGTATPPPLFSVPFNSPTRSGLDYIAAGIAWSIMNQHRDRALPTWVLMVEGRFNVGDPLIACQGGATTACRSPNGEPFPMNAGTDAGETRGTNALRIETRSSWRSGYVEPYAGLLFQIEWPVSAEQFYLPAGNLNGFVNDKPPIVGELTGGIAIIPWENRAGWQRFTLDFRFMGRYVSEGRDYSPLFDALGTSQNLYLTEPALEGDPSAAGAGDLRSVPFFGLTDVQSHAEIGARLGIEMRAARFVNFQLGAGLWYVEPYIITYADACNPNVDGASATAALRGTCRSGIINPHHRPVLGLPGQQFRMDEQVRFDLSFNVTGMF